MEIREHYKIKEINKRKMALMELLDYGKRNLKILCDWIGGTSPYVTEEILKELMESEHVVKIGNFYALSPEGRVFLKKYLKMKESYCVNEKKRFWNTEDVVTFKFQETYIKER